MISKEFKEFILLLDYNPSAIFKYYKVEKMHGLSLSESLQHVNNKEQSYIAGWCNYVPKESGEYQNGDPVFVFINLMRCNDDINTTALIFHEMMHCSGHVFNDQWLMREEEMIMWAERKTLEVMNVIKRIKNEY